jgi:mannose-1-phosphate guanylyltransferase
MVGRMYVVVLAGAAGTRLSPLCRPDRPKAFLPLLDEESLLQRTVARVLDGSELGVTEDDIWVVTDQRYGQLVRDQVPDVSMIVEPTGKNTAASVALATIAIDRPDDEVMLVLPADQSVEREPDFRRLLATAARLAERGAATDVDDRLVVLGVRPDQPSTDRAWLRPDTAHGTRVDGVRTWPLLAVEDAPAEARARDLLNLPAVAWSSGIHAWRRDAIRGALEKYTPLMTLIGTPSGSDLALRSAYDRLMPVSLAGAVLAGAANDRRVTMAAMDVGWNDLATWSTLLAAIAPGRAGRATGRVIQAGERMSPGPDDLLVRRAAGSLVVEEAPQGTIVADATLALLAGARHLGPEVQALIDRVDGQERAA